MDSPLPLVRHRWMLLMLALLAPLFGILTVEVVRPIVDNVDYIGSGWFAPTFRGVLGVWVSWAIFSYCFHQ